MTQGSWEVNLIEPIEHTLGVAYRLLHVIGMALILGGSAHLFLVARRGAERPVLDGWSLAAGYERLFWWIMIVQVMTGVGTLGLFGHGMPPHSSSWGSYLATKLALVLVLLAASVVRTAVVLPVHGRLASSADGAPTFAPGIHRRSERILQAVYGANTVLLLGVVLVAVRLAHG